MKFSLTRLSTSVLGRLLLYFSLATIPLVALAFYLAFDERRQEDSGALAEERATTQLVAEEVGVEFQLTQNVVAGLLHKESDTEICSSIRGNLEEFPQLAYLSLLEVGPGERDGRGVCSVTGRPLAPRTPLTDEELGLIRQLARSGDVAVGSVRLSPLTARAVIPVFGLVGEGSAGSRRIVVASVDLSGIDKQIGRLQVPEDAVLLVVDRNGIIGARNPVSQEWQVGKPAPQFERNLPQRAAFSGEVVSPDDGVSRYYTVRRIDSAGGLVVLMNRRSSLIFAASRRRLTTNLVSILIIFSAMFAIVWLNAQKYVGRPLRQLGEAADRIAAKELTARTGMDYQGEIGKLARSFDSMASAVEREQEHNLQLISSLRESERRFRALLENVHLAVLMVDRNGVLTFANDYFLSLTGWMREEITGHSLTDFIAEEFQEKAQTNLRALREYGHLPMQTENAILTKNGGKCLIEWNTTALRDLAGVPIGYCGLGVDVTEYRALMEQRQQSERLESVGRLAAGVAHDFNNLLTVINGYSDLALRRVSDENPLCKSMKRIREAGEQAAALTKQLLTFSRKQVIEPKPFELNQIIAESESMFRQILGGRVHLTTSLDPSAGHVRGDKGQLQQVLMNLVTNSLHATPDGGTIRIETSVAAHPEGDPGEWVLLTVADTGAGMDQKTLAHIFEPFFTMRKDGKGTGLGLAIVYGIVRQNNGHLTVESKPGCGTTFRIWWRRVSPSHEIEQVRAGLPVTGSETILVVEDRDDVRELVIAVLEKNGYRVLSAADADDAVLAAQGEAPIDLLLTDVMLPEMNGYELARLLTMRDPRLKVLVMSGYAGELVNEEMLSESGFDFIQKPLTEDMLAEKVRRILDARSPVV